jgi:hypothetical protein
MYVLYYTSMLQCWQLVWILVRTNHPCLGVGCHTKGPLKRLSGIEIADMLDKLVLDLENPGYFIGYGKEHN